MLKAFEMAAQLPGNRGKDCTVLSDDPHSQQAAIDQSLNETQQQCEEEYRIVRVKLHGVASPLQ
ncbi:hypothetical protein F444_08151, partial [Phytophthora nicotianae P1976]